MQDSCLLKGVLEAAKTKEAKIDAEEVGSWTLQTDRSKFRPQCYPIYLGTPPGFPSSGLAALTLTLTDSSANKLLIFF